MNTNPETTEQATHPEPPAFPQAQYSALFDELTTLEEGVCKMQRAGALLRIIEDRADGAQAWLKDCGCNASVKAYMAHSKDTACLLEAIRETQEDALQTIDAAITRAFSLLFSGR